MMSRHGGTSQMNVGKITDVMRPIDSKPPISSGGATLTTTITAYGTPMRRERFQEIPPEARPSGCR